VLTFKNVRKGGEAADLDGQFSKVAFLVIFYSKCPEALTFENVRKGGEAADRQSAGIFAGAEDLA